MDYVPKFDDFWMLYPRRVKKRWAERCWKNLTDTKKRRAMLALPRHIQWWAKHCEDMTTVPHPASWLNGERWDDEIEDKKVYAPPVVTRAPAPTVQEQPRPDISVGIAGLARMKAVLSGGGR